MNKPTNNRYELNRPITMRELITKVSVDKKYPHPMAGDILKEVATNNAEVVVRQTNWRKGRQW